MYPGRGGRGFRGGGGGGWRPQGPFPGQGGPRFFMGGPPMGGFGGGGFGGGGGAIEIKSSRDVVYGLVPIVSSKSKK